MPTEKVIYDKYTQDLLSTRFIVLWIATLVVIFAYISVHGMGHYYYNPDELSDIAIAKGTTLKEVLQFSLYEAHPPLGQILRHYWMMISDNIWFVRSFSLIFAVALVPLYYKLGTFLNGQLTGLCCSALIAFSHGCITQDFLVRNYTLFLFLLSLSFYFYLQWHKQHTSRLLLSYSCFAALAVLTHFSGIFAICSIASYEMGSLYLHKEGNSDKIRWLLANSIIAIIMCTSYYFWRDANAALNVFSSFSHSLLPNTYLLVATALYPLFVSYYILPSHGAAVLIIPMLVLTIFRKGVHPFFFLVCIAIGLGMGLVFTGKYPFLTSRHSLWVLPFIVTTAGWTVADFLQWCADQCSKEFKFSRLKIMAITVLIGGCACYSPAERFAETGDLGYYLDQGEYWKEYNHQVSKEELLKIRNYLSTLDTTHIILTGGKLFPLVPPDKNLYNYYGEYTANTLGSVGVIPYYHTRILFSTSYYPLQLTKMLQKTGDANTLVFMEMSWAPTFDVSELILCPTLDKKIITFPPQAKNHVITREELKNTPVVLLEISKQKFFEQAVSPTGKAHKCYRGSVEWNEGASQP